jgi:hypothetical protein
VGKAVFDHSRAKLAKVLLTAVRNLTVGKLNISRRNRLVFTLISEVDYNDRYPSHLADHEVVRVV